MNIFDRLVKLLKPYWKVLILIGFFLLISILLELIPPMLQKIIIDEIIIDRDLSRLGIMLIYLVGTYALQQALAIWDNFIRHKLGGKFILDLRIKLYSWLQKLSLSFFESTSTGELMSRVTNDVNALEHFITHGVMFLIVDFLRLIGAVIILFYMNRDLALLVSIPIPILAVSLRWFNKKIRPVYRGMRARLGDINAKLQDNLSGIQIIQAFAQEERELEEFSAESENYYNAVVRGIRYWSTFFPGMHFLTLLGNVIVLGVGSWMVINDSLTLGTLVAFLSYLTFLYQPVRRLIDIDNIIQEAIAAGERIFELMDEKPEITDNPGAIPLEEPQGKIEFDRVSFQYKTGDRVLNEVSFVMEPGEVVALVGPSGAGKTSLASLICRFYDPSSGEVRFDGRRMPDIQLRSLRNEISVVLQDTFLFNSTILENIRYGKTDADMKEIQEAARASYAHEFIESLPKGYNTEIGERGIRLSGGQKQRIALARAILKNPRVLILDEATSSVDAEAEYLIQQALESVLRARTALVIAHRLSTVKNADKIIALENGQIAEVGSHEDLLARNGLYSQLYERQLKFK